MRRTAISIYFFFLGMVFSSWASRIPDIKDRFRLDEAQLGSLLFMLPMGALAALPASGWMVQCWGSRQVSALVLLVYGLFLFAIGISDSIVVLSVVLFFFGFLGNLANIAMNAQGIAIQQVLGKTILSSLHAMWGLGAFAAAALSGWMMNLGILPAGHFAVVGGVAGLAAIIFYFFLVPDAAISGEAQKVFALPRGELLLLGLICFCVAMSEGAMADWSSLYYRQVVNAVHTASTAGYTAFALCMTVGRFAGDRLLLLLTHAQLLKLNGLFILSGIALALVFPVKVAVILGFAMVGLGVSCVFPIVYMLAARNRSMSPSASLAAVSSVGFTGFLLGPPIIGFVAEETGLRLSLWIVAVLGLFIAVLAGRVKASVE
jgi:predicted MFS family arabinose efflux permease